MKSSFGVKDIAVSILLVFGLLGIFYIFGKEENAVSDKRKAEQGECDSQFTSFEWKGHKYLKYSGYDTYYGTHVFNALLHDPDCSCWTNRLEAQHARNQ